MINTPKIALELLLLVLAGVMLARHPRQEKEGLAAWLALATMGLNVVFYYLAAFTLYEGWGQSLGLSRSDLHVYIWFDILKWGLLAFVLSKLALRFQFGELLDSFRLISPSRSSILEVLGWGIVGGVAATAAAMGLSHLEVAAGVLEDVPWGYFAQEADTYRALGLWGGLRNLLGEEILTRLGIQAMVMVLLQKNRYRVILSILCASLYFELWHNGMSELYFLNFSAAVIYGIVYHYRGYESAALSHAVSDWLLIVIIPMLFYA